jgi:hypothetical protein
MQQQMFDQFQQAMMMLVQMFSSLHRDQLGFIREELDRLHDLTHELHTLQKELAKRPPTSAGQPADESSTSPAPVPGAEAPANPASASAGTAPLGMESGGAEADAGLAQAEGRADAGPLGTHPESVASLPRADLAALAKAADLGAPAKEPGAVGSAKEEPPLPLSQPAPNPPPPGGGATDKDIHVWLYQRIDEIQRERQSRFPKIVTYMLGK